MYISKIHIINIRCFEDITINFENNGNPSPWTMITGDNAVGKTCLLRCVAIGLCDESSAAALMKELKGRFLRENNSNNVLKGTIEISLKTDIPNREYKITTDISRKSPKSPEQVRQRTEPSQNFPWEDIFVCGYGPHRALFADMSQENYIALEAVFTLFNNESHLQNPELILQRQNPIIRKQLAHKLLTILMLEGHNREISFSNKGMEIPGPWGTLPVEVLSDGYRSTVNWVTDFFGWSLYAEKISANNGDLSGILLIDELDQHLHPIWQRYIVKRLHDQFPKVQFITTTHSPLVAVGVADIDKAKLFRLQLDDHMKVKEEEIPTDHLKGMRADQILTSEAFGLIATKSPGSETDVARYYELLKKQSGSRKYQKELLKLEEQLSREISFGENEYERLVEKATRKALDELLTQEFKKIAPKILDFEMKRKLRDIFNIKKKNDKN